jgi:hypothetical protein
LGVPLAAQIRPAAARRRRKAPAVARKYEHG